MGGIPTQEQVRARVASARRVVVKIGSSSLTSADNAAVDPAKIDAIVDAVVERRRQGSQVIVVSSGAVAAGLAPLGLASRPGDLATRQAAAAVGGEDTPPTTRHQPHHKKTTKSNSGED